MNAVFLLILPVIFIAISIFAGSGSVPMRIGVIDEDNTFLTEYLKEGLEKNCVVISLKENEIKENLINDKIEYAIKIPRGFTLDLISEKDVAIKSYGIKDYNAFIPVKLYINSFLSNAKAGAKISNGDIKRFEEGIQYYSEGLLRSSYKSVIGASKKLDKLLQSLGFIVMFMMYLAINAASSITEDKKLKTYERILIAPISIKRYAIENILSFFAVVWFQIIMLFIILKFIFKMDYGNSFVDLVIFTIIYSIVSVSLGMAIVNLSRNVKLVSTITPLIVMPMSMVGGCFWPIWIMPDILQKISNFVPVTWAMLGMEKILTGGSLSAAGKEIIILLLFSLVFFLIGASKKSSFA